MKLIVELFAGNEIRILGTGADRLWVAQDLVRELGLDVSHTSREIKTKVFPRDDYVQKAVLADSLGREREYDVLTLKGVLMFINSTPMHVAPIFKEWMHNSIATLITTGRVTLKESVKGFIDDKIKLGEGRYFAEVALLERQSNEDKDLAMTYLKKEISVLYKAASLAESALRASTKAQKDSIRRDLDEVLNALACLERGDVDWRAYADHLRQSAEFRSFAQTITDDPDKQNMLVAKMFAIS